MSSVAFPPQLGTPPALPVCDVLPALLQALTHNANAVLQAPPGAGKTTLVPLALLQADWRDGNRILLLEPRRLAARAAARRMAALLGEPVGETVGYRIRQDSKVSARTRIEVVTEGILTRMLQDDPGLDGVAAVLFDEFHERSLHADLGLALCLDAQAGLRPDLRLLVMSATLDGGPVAALLGDAPVITSEGRAFPVEIRWDQRPAARFEDALTSLILRGWDEEPTGDLLVFLPGQGEIRRVQSQLEQYSLPGALITPLFGDLDAAAQDRALLPQPGRRKIVLATAIAETSLTIEGIRIVVDGGRMRRPRFDPNTGMTSLMTVPVSKAAAEQRRGRAGRLGPGVCYRLWSEADQRALAGFTAPEISDADLAPLALDLARWGISDPLALAWLDPPPAAPLAQARRLLTGLGALDEATGRLTPHGRAMADLPLHPRLAHMLITATADGLGGLACEVAALLGERDLLRGPNRDADLRLRVEILRDRRPGGDRGSLIRLREEVKALRRQMRISRDATAESVEQTGRVLALAYPDRIALRRGVNSLRYHLSGGRGACFADVEPLVTSDLLVIADLDGAQRESRIFLAAPLSWTDLEDLFAGQIRSRDVIVWDNREQIVTARRQRRLGELVLKDDPLPKPDPEAVRAALLGGIAGLGLTCLPWSPAAQSLRARVLFLHRNEPEAGWPNWSETALLEELPDWLGGWLDGCSRRSHLDRLDMAEILSSALRWEQRQALDSDAPTHLTVPSGSRIPIDYDAANGGQPVLAVRLQEMFGLADTPVIARGRVRLVLHLLSPARRPVQVTQDLASFWANAYKAVKADLKGQYPKHYWPDDPMQAEPTARAKPRPR